MTVTSKVNVPDLPDDLRFKAYPPFPPLPALDVVVDSWTDDQIQTWWNEAGRIEHEQRLVYQHNLQVTARWHEIFKNKGRGARGGVKVWFKEVMQALGAPSPSWKSRHDHYSHGRITIGSEKVEPSQVINGPYTLLGLVHQARQRRQRIVLEQQRESAYNLKLIALAAEYGIKATDFPDEQAFRAAVDAEAQRRFLQENFVDGTTVSLDDNICECAEWTVGDSRCSCGNRRIHLEISGDVVSGLYAFPQAH